MKKANWISYLIFFIGSMYLGPSSAVLLSFSPSSGTVNVGDVFDVDIVISDLYAADGSREIVSAFDLDVLYDSTVLNATGVTFGASLGDEYWFEVFNDAIFSSGQVDFAALSLLWDSDLIWLQPDDSFSLATLSFEALAEGISYLTFDQNSLPLPGIFDIKGLNTELLDVSAVEGAVTVVAVPEPGILFLMISGLFGLSIAIRKKKSLS